MLIGARDDGTGVAKVFGAVEECDVRLFSGVWVGKESGIKLFSHEDAEPFCQNIPNGQSRVIDLSASTIVHVAPKKTAVQELVEACEKLIDNATGGLIDGNPVCFVRGPDCSALRSALARVRQEGGV